MLGIVLTKDGVRAIEGPSPNPDAFRIVPMYWVSNGGYGAAIGEDHAYAFAGAGYPVERVA